MLVFLSSSVVVSVATTAASATTADYPDDKATLPPATTGRPVHTQATQGSPRMCGAWGYAVVGRGGHGGRVGGAASHRQ